MQYSYNRNKKVQQEAYFQKKHYLALTEDFETSFSVSNNNLKPAQLLLVAKGYFIRRDYSKCIQILNKIPMESTYILYQCQTLHFKASYLHQPTNIPSLKAIIQKYALNRTVIQGPPLNRFHAKAIQDLIRIIQIIEEADDLDEGFLDNAHHSNAKQEYKQPSPNIQEEEIFKQLGKKEKYEATPSYLIATEWVLKWEKYIKKADQNPGPITNFTIINHIANMLFYTEKEKQYMNTILFPLYPKDDYLAVSAKEWKLLYSKYGGIPVKRLVTRKTGWHGHTMDGNDTLIKIVIKYRGNRFTLQVANNLYWQKDVALIMEKHFKEGQLKEIKYGNIQYASVINDDLVREVDYPLNFVNIDFRRPGLDPEQQKRRIKIIRKFDLEPYKIQISDKFTPAGLNNLSNSCYLNASIQCLRNIDVVNEYFVTNAFLKDLNISTTNKVGSYGTVTCGFGDLLKGLWCMKDDDRRSGFSPEKFKMAFGLRFIDFDNYEQQDANQFLSFLLNCLHDDLNKYPDIRPRRISSSKNFEETKNIMFTNQRETNHSIITDLFQGYHYSSILCQNCGKDLHMFDIFLMLALPLPPLAENVQIFLISKVHVQDIKEKSDSACQLTIYLTNLNTVEDLVNLVISQHLNDNMKKPHDFLMLAMNGRDFQIHNEISLSADVKQMLNIKKKCIFFLYEKPQIENKQQEMLTIVEFKCNGSRCGYPRLIITPNPLNKSEMIAKLNLFLQNLGVQKEAYRSSTSQSLFYSNNKKQQDKQISPLSDIKVEQVKNAQYVRRIKVYMNRKHKLTYYKETTIPIGKTTTNFAYDLNTCFKISIEKERIDEREGWQCEQCKEQTVAYKQETLYSVGEVLVIVLKRFKDGEKITAKIDYPIKGLDISRFIDERNKQSKRMPIFDLQSVCIHRGSLNRGHYISYCKNPYDRKWYSFDDQSVREIPESQVISQHAYILFYRRRHQ